MPAITWRQFGAALHRVWRPRRNDTNHAHTLGLAVSGGSDSMALAHLCAQLNSVKSEEHGLPPHTSELRFRAFVVDHKARSGSTAEARKVCRYLERTGVPSEILTLDWSTLQDEKGPLGLPDFESKARTLRYQALGHACRRYGITSLLLGHHRDDQAETVLERIVGGYMGLGLAGIKGISRIPECHGLAGLREDVHDEIEGNGGDGRDLASADYRYERAVYSEGMHKELIMAKEENRFLHLATPGITIHRPLLNFSKQDIIETCRENDVLWVEDHTNYDHTATIRNTIRNLLRGSKLPQALHTERLLHVKETTYVSLCTVRSYVQRLMAETELLRFEMRSGVIVWRLPVRSLHRMTAMAGSRTSSHVTATYLAALAQPVTPLSSISVEAGRTILERMFRSGQRSNAFTVAETLWARSSDSSNTWTVSRQPMKRLASAQPLCTWSSPTNPSSQATWQLWDGRYWIKVTTKPGSVICCRPFRAQDVSNLRQSLPQDLKSALNRILDQVVKHPVGFTMPALVDRATDLVQALPTMDFRLRGYSALLSYEIRYKAVDFDNAAQI